MAYIETTSGAQFFSSTALAATTTSTPFDVTGAGSGNAPAMIGANGVNTAMGYDIGAGDGMAVPEVIVEVTTAGTGTGTFTFTLEAAPDNGAYSPGTYVPIYVSEPFVGTALTKGKILKFPVPPLPPGFIGLPRFYALVATLANTATVSLTAALLLNAPDNVTPTIYGNNFVAV